MLYMNCVKVHNMETIYMAFVYYKQHLKIFSEIRVMSRKLKIAVSRASLIFQKDFPKLLALYFRKISQSC